MGLLAHLLQLAVSLLVGAILPGLVSPHCRGQLIGLLKRAKSAAVGASRGAAREGREKGPAAVASRATARTGTNTSTGGEARRPAGRPAAAQPPPPSQRRGRWTAWGALADNRQREMLAEVSSLVPRVAPDRMDLRGVQVGGVLGKGAFSTVYRALWGTIDCAVKVCKVEGREKMEQMIVREASISFGVKHPNVVVTYKYALKRRIRPLVDTPADTPLLDPAAIQRSVSSAPVVKDRWLMRQESDRATCPSIPMDVVLLGADDCAEKYSHLEPSQVKVWWELQLLQECCNLGTLRSAIKHRRLAESEKPTSGNNLTNRRLMLPMRSELTISHSMASGVPGTSHGECLITDDTLQDQFGNVAFEHESAMSEPVKDLNPARGAAKGVAAKQDMKLVLTLLTDIAEGMTYVHSCGVIHGDLKAANVLLKSSRREDGQETVVAKVADFGTSIVLGENETASNFFAGTPTHMAPEVLATSTVSRASDVYSFGITIYETVTGQRPYPARSTKEIMYAVVHYKLRPTLNIDLPRPVLALMHHCWHQDPSRRPTFAEVTTKLLEITSELAPGPRQITPWQPDDLPTSQDISKPPARPRGVRRAASVLQPHRQAGCEDLLSQRRGSMELLHNLQPRSARGSVPVGSADAQGSGPFASPFVGSAGMEQNAKLQAQMMLSAQPRRPSLTRVTEGWERVERKRSTVTFELEPDILEEFKRSSAEFDRHLMPQPSASSADSAAAAPFIKAEEEEQEEKEERQTDESAKPLGSRRLQKAKTWSHRKSMQLMKKLKGLSSRGTRTSLDMGVGSTSQPQVYPSSASLSQLESRSVSESHANELSSDTHPRQPQDSGDTMRRSSSSTLLGREFGPLRSSDTGTCSRRMSLLGRAASSTHVASAKSGTPRSEFSRRVSSETAGHLLPPGTAAVLHEQLLQHLRAQGLGLQVVSLEELDMAAPLPSSAYFSSRRSSSSSGVLLPSRRGSSSEFASASHLLAGLESAAALRTTQPPRVPRDSATSCPTRTTSVTSPAAPRDSDHSEKSVSMQQAFVIEEAKRRSGSRGSETDIPTTAATQRNQPRLSEFSSLDEIVTSHSGTSPTRHVQAVTEGEAQATEPVAETAPPVFGDREDTSEHPQMVRPSSSTSNVSASTTEDTTGTFVLELKDLARKTGSNSS